MSQHFQNHSDTHQAIRGKKHLKHKKTFKFKQHYLKFETLMFIQSAVSSRFSYHIFNALCNLKIWDLNKDSLPQASCNIGSLLVDNLFNLMRFYRVSLLDIFWHFEKIKQRSNKFLFHEWSASCTPRLTNILYFLFKKCLLYCWYFNDYYNLFLVLEFEKSIYMVHLI